jgi:hypothetical protein
MTSYNHNPMNREELEIKINDAADGQLDQDELNRLEMELHDHPDLMEDYHAIINLPDLSGIYGRTESYRNDISVHQILKKIENEESSSSFDVLSVTWFKKYALAASLMILGLTSAFYFSQPDLMNGDMPLEELLYSFDEPGGDDYVYYLNEWIDD